ncbi:MAG: cytochrome C oxidase subunit II [Gemmatimonadota bacterium]
MARVESSVTPPAPGWARRFPLDEKVFLWAIGVSVVFMSAFVVVWLFLGNQNVPTDSYRATPEAFSQKVQAFVTKYGRDDGRVAVPPGEDAYVMAARYAFYPEIVLEAGEKYRIWISSVDALHGFSIVGGHQNINLEIAPEHLYGGTFTPEKPGEYLIVCNEYCGLGHHGMKGRIIVEEG